MEVIKALIIGLGSSGIEVCDRIIERIRWELGDVRRAPWVRFLGIETNSTVETELRDMGDLLLLSIPADEYSALLERPQDYEEQLHLSKWADTNILRALPSNEVTAGAGNIRMVGRLVFFYRYQEIDREVSKRLNALRQLQPAQAMETRGELLTGENPPLGFVGSLRIFVVGTLCGGTCSGMVSDFGFLLRLLTNPEERIVGLFTLPPANLTIAAQPLANRYKKNAYTALVELNHYYLVHRENESPIIFPDGGRPDLRQTPYDHPYLLFPRGITKEDIQSLHQMIADRIFLNIFAPGTDSFRRTVDAPQVGGGQDEEFIRGDRYYRAHVFLNVGIATMEYPAERIVAACTNRLLAYTLGQWNSRTLQEGETAPRLKELGLEWERLCEWLFHTPSGESVDGACRRLAEEIADLAKSSPDKAREGLGNLRRAFENHGIVHAAPEQVLYPGSVVSTCLQNQAYALEQFRSAVRALMQRDLLDYRFGPAALRDLMAKAKSRIDALRNQQTPEVSEAVGRVNRLLDRIARCRRSRKLSIAGLKQKELRYLTSELRKALNDEIEQRLMVSALIALRDLPPSQGHDQPGLITQLSREVEVLERRLRHLVQRVLRQRELFEQEDRLLSRSVPQAAGVVLFNPDPDGTVTDEYHRCLEKSGSQGITWQQQRERIAQEILREWTELVDRVTPLGQLQMGEDWLYQEFQPHAELPIPPKLLEPIIRAARRPFLRILQSNVFEKWWFYYTDPSTRTQKAREVPNRVVPSVRVNRYLAERGGRSPIAVWSALALPSQGERRQEFIDAIRGASGFPTDYEDTTSPFSYRAIMLQEWHRWPLSGVPEITGQGGLASAECGDFPSFHTRKDVAWTPLTDDEIRRMDTAYKLIVLGVLCGFVEPQGGALRIQQGEQLGTQVSWRLPLSLRAAARRVAIERTDIDGRNLNNLLTVLDQRIRNKRAECKDDEQFVRFLVDRLRAGEGGTIPDWSVDVAKRAIVKYCAADTQLRQALMIVSPIPEEVKRSLWKNSGDSRPTGQGTYERDGYYCEICGGEIGATEEEALANGWCCYVNPDHCFYDFDI